MREVYKVIYLVVAFQICSVGLSNAVELSFGHNAYEVVSIEPEASTGLEKIYVLHDLSGVEMSYMPQSDGANVEWSRFDESGGGYAVPVTGVTFDGMKYTLQNPEGNCGYIINENNRQYCFWLVDYSRYQFSINAISFNSRNPSNAGGLPDLTVTESGQTDFHSPPVCFKTFACRHFHDCPSKCVQPFAGQFLQRHPAHETSRVHSAE